MDSMTFYPGDVVTLKPDAPYARWAGPDRRGVIESVVTDTPADPARGPLYHIKLSDPQASGHWDSGYVRNYGDELMPEGSEVAP